MQAWLDPEITAAKVTGTFHMPGRRDDVGAFLRAADAYALTSREDPFPSVALEAIAAGLQVIAFERSGGIPDMLTQTGAGSVVPYGDVTAMAEAVSTRLHRSVRDPVRRRQAKERQRLAATRFAWRP